MLLNLATWAQIQQPKCTGGKDQEYYDLERYVGSGVKCRAFTRKRGKYFGMEGGLATLESF